MATKQKTLSTTEKEDLATAKRIVAKFKDKPAMATAVKEAQKIICNAHVFVSESFLLGSKKENKFVVIEKSPKRCAIRKPKNNHIIVANHFLTKIFQLDPANIKYQHKGTSIPRYRRMKELVHRSKTKLNYQTQKKFMLILILHQ